MANSVISNTDDSNKNNINNGIKIVEVVKIVHKCPDYLLRAQKHYYNRKKLEDPEYIVKKKENTRKYRDANRDHVNELARIRRQKKKAEEKAKQDALLNKELEISNKAKEDLPPLETLTV